MSQAQPGQIRLDEQMWAETQDCFIGHTLTAVQLKGIDEPVNIIDVHGLKFGTNLTPPSYPILERETQQKILQSALFTLKQGQGSHCLIKGETGLGKTTLVSALAYQAKQEQMMVLVGQCQPHGVQLPLLLWRDVLTGLFDPTSEEVMQIRETVFLEKTRRLGLGQFEQPLADLLKISSGDNPISEKQKQIQAWDEVSDTSFILQILEILAAQQPLVLILEDVDWIDDASREVWGDVLALAQTRPLLVLATARMTSVTQSQVLSIEPLSDVALVEVVRQGFGAKQVESQLAQWLYEQSSGNPLYAEQLCLALQNDEAVFQDQDSDLIRWNRQRSNLPLFLHELFLARFDALSPLHQEVLKQAAVIGLTFAADALLALRQNGRQKLINEKTVWDALDVALATNFIMEQPQQTYRFTRPLLHETIYETLSFSQRQAWHVKIASWLQDTASEPKQFLALIAHHYLRGDKLDQAVHFKKFGKKIPYHFKCPSTSNLGFISQPGTRSSI